MSTEAISRNNAIHIHSRLETGNSNGVHNYRAQETQGIGSNTQTHTCIYTCNTHTMLYNDYTKITVLRNYTLATLPVSDRALYFLNFSNRSYLCKNTSGRSGKKQRWRSGTPVRSTLL